MRGLAVVALIGIAAPAAAWADDDEPELRHKRMAFAERKGKLVMSVAFTELFDDKAYRALSSGFASTVVVRATVYEEKTDAPVSFAIAAFHAVYDLWDEEYRVRISDAAGDRDARYRSRSDALQALTEVNRLAVASLDNVKIGPRYYCDLTIELNPVSEERLAEMRRWLTKRAGSTSIDGGSSFFGSFVSVFVNPKLRGADRVLRLRSQPFYRVKP
jgi:hypothetical protein